MTISCPSPFFAKKHNYYVWYIVSIFDFIVNPEDYLWKTTNTNVKKENLNDQKKIWFFKRNLKDFNNSMLRASGIHPLYHYLPDKKRIRPDHKKSSNSSSLLIR